LTGRAREGKNAIMTADPADLLARLIACPSVTPADAGALGVLARALEPLGFACERIRFSDRGTPDVENLYARLGHGGPHLMFAGHTDVVPAGEETKWTHPPFSARIADGRMYGRGAVDMKGGIACFVAAVARYITSNGAPTGSISLLITGDEEGPSINGTAKLLQWAKAKGARWDGAIVGEPTNPETVGDMIKIGRRGSLSGRIAVTGVQGHSAYPQLADNPVHGLLDLLGALLSQPFDGGTRDFQPSNLQITSVDVANKAVNVIPGSATAQFNIRFNDRWNEATIKAEILGRLTKGAARRGGGRPVQFAVEWIGHVSPVFLTANDTLVSTLSRAVEAETGRMPALSTTGGTSDARFIKDYCPVVEFGLVGKTMHGIDENVALADLEALTGIYRRFLDSWFAVAR
jgi:succinyl-diaminopimelate desuccinylase